VRRAFRGGLPWPRLAALLGAAVLAWAGLQLTGTRGGWPDAEAVAAMELFLRAQRILWQTRDRLVDDETRTELAATDVLRTGLVGVEWSPLTTTPGSLAAKRTTAHPLWVMVFRDWFRETGSGGGDSVAVGASGSFPGMLLAARIAAESMQIRPIVIGSLTSSNYGANLPEMDLAEMDRVLCAAGLLTEPAVAFSPGGEEDAARDLEQADREALRARLAELGPLASFPESLAASIAWRDEVFWGLGASAADSRAPRVFINIGGHAANYGVGVAPLALPSGLIPGTDGRRLLGPVHDEKNDSVALRAVRRNVPVINVLNIRAMAAASGIPFDPARIPSPATIRLSARLSAGHRISAGVLGVVFLIWLAAWRVSTPGPREWFDLSRRGRNELRGSFPEHGEVP
jgi:poly-gamma-glutamate system protein